jgi:Dyp-type peroxidase family
MALDPMDLSNFKLLSNLQGNIIKGHGRDHTAHVFIHFDSNKIPEIKAWLIALAEETLTSCQLQLKQREIFKRNQIAAGLFASFYLSATGYKALGQKMPGDTSFLAGMKSASIQAKLKDPVVSQWDEGYRHEIDAMLLLAHDNMEELGKTLKDMITIISVFSEVVHIEYGHAIRNQNGDGIEHFGYADGVSQPLFLQDEINALGKIDKWDPEAPLDLVLIKEEDGDETNMGSYFVYRKLEQRVKAFKLAEKALGEALHLEGEDDKRAGAMLIGRFEDGTPVTELNRDGIIGSGIANNFNYDQDSDGARCPFHAHIRKSNPRGEGNPAATTEFKSHMIARRGIPFGHRDVNTDIDPSIPQMPVDGVGLLFMCHQASIINQFEFIQTLWINNPDFPKPAAGTDPLLGQGMLSTGDFAAIWDDKNSLEQKSFESFIDMKGGEYFFAPSLSFLKEMK